MNTFRFVLVSFIVLFSVACSGVKQSEVEARDARIAELEARLEGAVAAREAIAKQETPASQPIRDSSVRQLLPPPGMLARQESQAGVSVGVITPEGRPIDRYQLEELVGRKGPHILYAYEMPWTPPAARVQTDCDGWCYKISNYTDHKIAVIINGIRVNAIKAPDNPLLYAEVNGKRVPRFIPLSRGLRNLDSVNGARGVFAYAALINPNETLHGMYALNEYDPATNAMLGRQTIVLQVEHYTLGAHSGAYRYLKTATTRFTMPGKPEAVIKVQG